MDLRRVPQGSFIQTALAQPLAPHARWARRGTGSQAERGPSQAASFDMRQLQCLLQNAAFNDAPCISLLKVIEWQGTSVFHGCSWWFTLAWSLEIVVFILFIRSKLASKFCYFVKPVITTLAAFNHLMAVRNLFRRDGACAAEQKHNRCARIVMLIPRNIAHAHTNLRVQKEWGHFCWFSSMEFSQPIRRHP